VDVESDDSSGEESI